MNFFILLLLLSSIFWDISNGDRRIYQGDKANLDEYPYVAKIIGSNPPDEWHCTGILISTKWILTVRDCLKNGSVTDLHVCMGEDEIVNYKSCKNLREGIFDVTDYSREPGNGLLLVKLNKPYKISEKLKIGLIPTKEIEEIEMIKCITLGWGYMLDGEISRNLRLAKADRAYACTRMDIPRICADFTERYPCQADSGGPLVCNGKIIGALLNGTKICGETYRYTAIYTRIDKGLNLIKSTLAETTSKANLIIKSNIFYILALVNVFILSKLK